LIRAHGKYTLHFIFKEWKIYGNDKTNHNNTQNRKENSTEIFQCIAAGVVCL
jgi:hypothetical protein